MHADPNHADRPAPDADATGCDPRAHYAPPVTMTRYQVWHAEHALSPEYDTWTEAELFRVFETPGTDDYTIRVVRATEPNPERRTPRTP